MANYKPGKWWDGNETIIIPAGSFITSERNLAKTVKITQKQIRGGLRALERDQFISVQRAQRWTMISVCKWETYQIFLNDEGAINNDTEGATEGALRAQSGRNRGAIGALTKERNKERREEEDLCAFALTECTSVGSNHWKSEFFEQRFWPSVWMKRGKGAAEKAFKKAATGQGRAEYLLEKAIEQGPLIMADAKKRKSTPLHVSTWLNGRRYEDDWGEAEETGEDLY